MAAALEMTVNGRAVQVRVDTEDGELCVWLGDACHKASLQRTDERGLYSLFVDGRSFEIFARERPGGWELLVGNRVYQVELGRRRGEDAAQLAGAWTLTSPMTGQVAEVRVRPGDAVEQGQTLVVVESMKMNNELVAARAGTVADVAVAPGDRVDKGKLLVRVE